MKQILFHLGPLVIPAYGLFVGLGIVLGMHFGEMRSRARGLRPFVFLDTAVLGVIGGVLGASVFHFAFSGGNLPTGGSGRSFFGGLLGGVITAIIWARIRGYPILVLLDSTFMYVPLGQGIGRIGCWFYGCCHGRVCDPSFPLGVEFPRIIAGGKLMGSPAFLRHVEKGLIDTQHTQSLSVYPTQIMSVILLVLVFLVLKYFSDRNTTIARTPGSTIMAYLILNGLARFLEEFFRDHTRYLGILTNAQVVAVIGIIAGATGMIWLSRMGSQRRVA